MAFAAARRTGRARARPGRWRPNIRRRPCRAKAIAFFADKPALAKESSGRLTIDAGLRCAGRAANPPASSRPSASGQLAAGDSLPPVRWAASTRFIRCSPRCRSWRWARPSAPPALDAARGLYANRFAAREAAPAPTRRPGRRAGCGPEEADPWRRPTSRACRCAHSATPPEFALFAAAGARVRRTSPSPTSMPRIVDSSIRARCCRRATAARAGNCGSYLPYFTEIGYAMPAVLRLFTLSLPGALRRSAGRPARAASIARRREPAQAWLWELLTRRIEQTHARLEASKGHDRGHPTR